MNNEESNFPTQPEEDPSSFFSDSQLADSLSQDDSFGQTNPAEDSFEDEELTKLYTNNNSLKEPEEIVEHFVNGRPVRKKSTSKIVLTTSAAAIAIFLLFISGAIKKGGTFIGSLFSTQPQITTAFTKQLKKGRKIFIESNKLNSFAPNLRPDNVVGGLDFELYDNNKKVDPSRFSIKTKPAQMNFAVLIDLSLANRNELTAKRKRLEQIIQFINKLAFQKNGYQIKKNLTLFTYSSRRSKLIYKGKKTLPKNTATHFNNFIVPGSNKDLLLMKTLKRLSRQKTKNHQILYISDYPLTQSRGFNSERLYNFLKKHHQFQLYNINIGRGKPIPNRDPFYYLSNNTHDFKQQSWAFGAYQLISRNRENQLNELKNNLIKAVPVSQICVTYYPDEEKINEEFIANPRKLKILLRRNPYDLKLSQLPKQLFNPLQYRFKLPTLPHFASIKPQLTKKKRIIAQRQFLFALKKDCSDFQIIAAKIANHFKARIDVAHQDGIFLATSIASNQSFSQKLNQLHNRSTLIKQLRFIAPHRIFRRKFVSQKADNIDWQKRFILPQKNTSPIIFKNNFYIFQAGNKFPSSSALEQKGKIVLYSSTNREKKQHFPSLAAALFTQNSTIEYPNTVMLGSAPITIKEAGKTISCASGFEIITALLTIRKKSTISSKGIFYIDNLGYLPKNWQGAESGIQKFLEHQIKQLKEQKIALIAPLPHNQQNKQQANIFYAAAALPGSPYPTLDSTNLTNHNRYYLLPGSKITYNEYTVGGRAVAAAALVAGVARIQTSLPGSTWGEIAEILYSSAELRGELVIKRATHNQGILTTRMLSKVIKNRKRQKELIIKFRDFKKNAYRQADSLLQNNLKGDSTPARIFPLPADLQNHFKRTYQFFDRNALHTREKDKQALYDLASPFILKTEERKELAVVAHNGTLFLLCTRNGNRGWIINLESILPAKSKNCPSLVQFDQDDHLIFTLTGHGEIVAIDIYSGLLQTISLQINSKRYPNTTALLTDHSLGNGFIAIDSTHNQLWFYGTGSRYLMMAKYTRIKNTLHIKYQSNKVCNQTPLYKKPIFPGSDACDIFSPPVMFSTGSINFIRRAMPGSPKNVYFKFSKEGKPF